MTYNVFGWTLNLALSIYPLEDDEFHSRCGPAVTEGVVWPSNTDFSFSSQG